jgi:hypothetical protein
MTVRELQRVSLSPRGVVSQATQSSTMEPKSCLIGDGFRIEAPGGMFVQVAPGHGFIYDPIDLPSDIGAPDLEGISDLSTFKPVSLDTAVTFAVPAAPGLGLGRTDIIEIRADRRLEDAITRQQFDVGAGSFVNHIFSKTLAFALDGQTGVVLAGGGDSTAAISYKIGTAAAVTANGNRRDGNSVVTPPAVSPGYIKLGDIQVNNGTTSITQQFLNDRRVIGGPHGVTQFAATWRLEWGGGTPVVTLLALNAPPGIRVGMIPSASIKACGTIVITGGEITGATAVVTGAFPVGSSTEYFTTYGLSSAVPQSASGAQVSNFDTAVPPIVVGGLTKAVVCPFESKAIIDGGSVNRTSINLELVFVSVHGTLRY